MGKRLYGPPTDRRRRYVAQEARNGWWRVWDRQLPGFVASMTFNTRTEARDEADRLEREHETGFYPTTAS